MADQPALQGAEAERGGRVRAGAERHPGLEHQPGSSAAGRAEIPRWRHHQVPEAHRMEVLLPALLPGLGGHEFHRSGIDLEALPERGARHLGLVLGAEVADQLHCSGRDRRDPRRRQFPLPAHLDTGGARQVKQAGCGVGQGSGDPEFQAEGGVLGQGAKLTRAATSPGLP